MGEDLEKMTESELRILAMNERLHIFGLGVLSKSGLIEGIRAARERRKNKEATTRAP